MASGFHKILIVEDDEVNLLIAEHILEKAGYEVNSVTNGELAIEAIEKDDYDLILMDIEMPLMDGLEAANKIRSTPRGRNIRIIALTAHTLPEKLAEIEAADIDDYMIKPFDVEKFESLLVQLSQQQTR